MNRVTISGRMAADADVRYTQDGKTVCRLRIAVPRIAGDEVDWINVTAFGKTAEFIGKYCQKGTMVLVDGRIRADSYKNRDGQNVYTVDVTADRVEIADWTTARPKDGAREPEQEAQQSVEGFEPVLTEDDDFPF